MIVSSIERMGASVLRLVNKLGRSGIFLGHSLLGMMRVLRRPSLIVQQIYSVGVLSVAITVIAGFFVGMVLGLQGYYQLSRYAAESSLGLGVALTLVRELGPVVAGLLFAGRAGSALTAEIGLMKATDQLAAMEMMAVNPYERIIGPRFWAGLISLPLLAAMFSAVGVLGSYIVAVGQFGVDSGVFMSIMQNGVDFYYDVLNGIIKSLIFGLVVTWIALFEGYSAAPTSNGVSLATTRTVVTASLSILALDYVLTALMFGGV
ncbi:MAG: phospholipid/cholesterol/gamma-HCH transport system permease protein [Saprospiraceae bacterium]|jgi:phospholipid/cholesterol/gamma-HCH transport system permease protein